MDMYTLNQIPSEAKIRKYLRQIVFGGKVFCPECRHTNPLKYEDRYRCRRCKSKFSLTSHTWLANMKLPLVQWWMLLWCWTKKIPVQQTHHLTGLSEVSVYHWFDQFRLHLPEEYHVLEQIVQMDEAFFTNWCLIGAKQVGTRKLAWELIYQSHPQRQHATSFRLRRCSLELGSGRMAAVFTRTFQITGQLSIPEIFTNSSSSSILQRLRVFGVTCVPLSDACITTPARISFPTTFANFASDFQIPNCSIRRLLMRKKH